MYAPDYTDVYNFTDIYRSISYKYYFHITTRTRYKTKNQIRKFLVDFLKNFGLIFYETIYLSVV